MGFRSVIREVGNRWDPAFSIRQKLDMIKPIIDRKLGRERSWSQFGEDEILCRELDDVMATGFYLDIGANHPARLSNTYRLYRRSMRGITVEPGRVLSSLHEQFRPEDVHLCAGAGEENGVMTFYRIFPHANSTFSAEQYREWISTGSSLISKSLVPVLTVRSILEGCTFPNRPIFALLSVDTESLDVPVLRGNDWCRFRPRLVVVKILETMRLRATFSWAMDTIYLPKSATTRFTKCCLRTNHTPRSREAPVGHRHMPGFSSISRRISRTLSTYWWCAATTA